MHRYVVGVASPLPDFGVLRVGWVRLGAARGVPHACQSGRLASLGVGWSGASRRWDGDIDRCFLPPRSPSREWRVLAAAYGS